MTTRTNEWKWSEFLSKQLNKIKQQFKFYVQLHNREREREIDREREKYKNSKTGPFFAIQSKTRMFMTIKQSPSQRKFLFLFCIEEIYVKLTAFHLLWGQLKIGFYDVKRN